MLYTKDGSRAISAEEFDEMFDSGDDAIDDFVDWEHSRVVEPAPGAPYTVTLTKKVNLDLPTGVIEQIDVQARRFGQTRQGLLRQWIWERLREEQERDLRLGVPPTSDVAAPNEGEVAAPGERAAAARA